MASMGTAAAAMYYAGCEDHLYEPHFLQSCALCNKHLGFNSDIFMYRGDTPFCSKECRQEQVDMDEAKERRKWMKSGKSAKKAASASKSSSSSSSSAASQPSSNRKSETVAVA